MVNDSSECLHELEWNNKLAVAISRELSISSKEVGSDSVYCFDFPNNIYENSINMLLHKNFPHSDDLNRFIRFARESGLILKWLNQYRSYNRQFQSTYTALRLETIIILLALIGCMIFLATGTLIFERIVNRKVQTPNSKRFWQYSQVIIDPYRHFLLNKYTKLRTQDTYRLKRDKY